MELEDVSNLSAPLRRQRDEAREELAGRPEPKPIPTVDQVDPEKFRARITEAWRATDISVRRKAFDRIVVEVRLEPGVALVRYAWTVEPDACTYQDPLGPPSVAGGRNWGWCAVEAVRRPRVRAL